MREWRQVLTLDANDEEAHDSLAGALYARGKAAEALAEWRLGTRDAVALRQMAWVMATSPDASVRNGAEAAALAVEAIERSGAKDAAAWDTLAAAYAEAGKFADAAQTAARALALAEAARQAELAAAIRGRIRLYQSQNAFREAPAGAR